MLPITKPNSHSQQLGFALVEFMIAMTISLVLLAGAVQVLMSNKASSNLQSGLGRLQENGRGAMDILADDIGMAGYSPNAAAVGPINTPNTADNFSENLDLGFTAANNTASDVIEISYRSPTDCLGQSTAAADGIAINRYYINGTNLMCLGNGAVAPDIIAVGVENMQILYGEDTDEDGLANRYITAPNIGTFFPIVSVRIALLCSTVESAGAVDNNARYTLLNVPITGPFNDNLIRKVFTRTIVMRNT